jgi:hypothetical protein
MYEMADQTWRDRPRRMSVEIARHTAMQAKIDMLRGNRVAG